MNVRMNPRCICTACAALLAPEESHKHYEWHAAIERMIALATIGQVAE